ncbi:MAG: hypothetical protein AB4290_30510 [Spirulina sp.]
MRVLARPARSILSDALKEMFIYINALLSRSPKDEKLETFPTPSVFSPRPSLADFMKIFGFIPASSASAENEPMGIFSH